MSNLVKALIGLAALAFMLAVLTHFTGGIMRTQAEAYSRASGNLALLDCLGADIRGHWGRWTVALEALADGGRGRR
jgi:hypothetical protein